jgi:hypothetical protein
MRRVTRVDFPGESGLGEFRQGADFWDSWSAPLVDASLSPTEIFLRASRATPRWVSRAMAARNALARRLGLKDVGAMDAARGKPAAAYRRGDRLGIFTVFDVDASELRLGIDDRHLDVRVSVLKVSGERAARYVVSTVVRVHNRLGRLYMLPVGRVHPFVVRAMMRGAEV